METYTISELEKLLGMPRRTIHFYVQEGVIPPPSGRGGPAKYGEEHLVRLQMFKLLKSAGVKTTAIKTALKGMTLEEMRIQLAKSGESGQRIWDSNAVDNWVGSGSEQSPESIIQTRNISFTDLGGAPATASIAQGNILANLRMPPRPHEAEWTRITVIEGVEVSLRSDIPERVRQIVKRMVEDLRASM